ncbi:MAG: DNA methylase [Planctomycetes bacterium]|nr:DNA methylase [Planctomycetota bacterium]
MTPTTESLEHIAESLRPLAVPLASLTLDPANARRHPERNLGAVEASLRLYGQRKPVVVRRQGMIVEAGNGTVEAARRLGWAHVAAVIVDDDPITATGYSIADNRTAELAEWDDEALSKLLLELEKGDVDLDALGWNERELDDLLEGLDGRPGDEPQGEDAGPTEPPEEPVSQPGEVYALGPHRLLCGDSTDAEAVARLMAGEKARLMATDPPYLVDYDGTNHGYLTPEQRERAARGGSYGGKRWDDYNEASATLWRDFLNVALPHLEDDAPIYQWHASRRQALVEAAWQENGLLVHQTIVWVKKRPVLTRSHFLWTYEPCFYGWKQGFQPERDRRPPPDTRNVWEIGTDTLDVKDVHPTQKPLEVCRWPIRWHLRRGELCYEPFGGSGTCVIAAAMEGRRCYAIELSPAFCDVIRKRWGDYARSAGLDPGTGALPRGLGQGRPPPARRPRRPRGRAGAGGPQAGRAPLRAVPRAGAGHARGRAAGPRPPPAARRGRRQPLRQPALALPLTQRPARRAGRVHGRAGLGDPPARSLSRA